MNRSEINSSGRRPPVLFVLLAGSLLTLILAPACFGQPAPSTVDESNELPRTDFDAEVAQTGPDEHELKTGTNEFGFFVAGGPAVSTFTGLRDEEARDRAHFQLGVRYGRVLYGGENVAWEYMAEFTPVNLAFGNIVRDDPSMPASTRRKTSYGFGFAPLGLRLVLRPQKKVKPFLAANFGAIIFQEQMPIPDTRQFNYTSEFDGGVLISTGNKRAVTIGFKFNHISNAGTGDLNPGINNALVYVGYSFFK